MLSQQQHFSSLQFGQFSLDVLSLHSLGVHPQSAHFIINQLFQDDLSSLTLWALQVAYDPTEPAVNMTKNATISTKIMAIIPCTVLLMYTDPPCCQWILNVKSRLQAVAGMAVLEVV
jgi:hypothetical protein